MLLEHSFSPLTIKEGRNIHQSPSTLMFAQDMLLCPKVMASAQCIASPRKCLNYFH